MTSSSSDGQPEPLPSVADHYRRLLARHYTWIFGEDFERKVDEQRDILIQAGFRSPGPAVDLGCGSGFQTLALADLGASRVFAIDSSEDLLRELASRAEERPVTLLHGDLRNFRELVEQPISTIVCMGDTLTHLSNKDEVTHLFSDVAAALHPEGLFILSWRDTSDLAANVQFIPVRSSEERIFLCCLENRPDQVLVHDLVYEREPAGWAFQNSSYPKLKLAAAWVKTTMKACGIAPRYERVLGGMTILAARHLAASEDVDGFPG